jgi:prepilin-type N-terminal cleavage/methylation domain-containing protein
VRAVSRRGFTIVELLVALVLLSVLVGAVADVVARQWRAQAALDARRAAHAQLLAAADALRPMLRMAAGDGDAADSSDLAIVSDSLLEVRATMGASVVCAVVDARTVELPPVAAASPALTWWRAAPQPGAAALFHGDRGWVARDVEALGTAVGGCAGAPLAGAMGAAPRFRLRLVSPLPSGIVAGAPVRFVRRVRWLHYRASDGRWYLGEREWDGAFWTGTQPVAGPLRPPGPRRGLSVVARDSAGNVVDATGRVVRIEVVVRADAGPSVDSVAFAVAPRNGG